jgi:tetratricopeptide (TPR) repeat protein/tRNA A-37 threonylcarbamoyl transferase component Bud32
MNETKGHADDQVPADADRRVQEIGDLFLDRLQAGESVDRGAVVAAHPELAGLLEKRLALVENLHRAACKHRPGDSRDAVSDTPIALPTGADTLSCPPPPTGRPADAAPPGQLPERIGRYHIRELLGQGASGAVYRAYDPRFDREVALKVFRSARLAGADFTERFQREARIAAQLRHPYIVPVHDAGEHDGCPYIDMRLVRGETLEARLKRGLLPPRESAELVRKLADALDYAHGFGIIHRDLKPANILLDERGEPQLTDFGLARSEAGELSITEDGQILGTPAYMSPEQAGGGSHQADRRTDVYGLGAVLFRLLTGRVPFPADDSATARDGLAAQVYRVIHTDPVRPRSLNPVIPRDLETICLKCLRKEPKQRYGSADALAADLKRWLAGEATLARPVTWAEQLWRWCRRRPAVAGLLVAVAVTFAAGTGVSSYFAVQALDQAEKTRGERDAKAREKQRAMSSYRLAREGVERSLKKVTDDPRLQAGPMEDLRLAVHDAERVFLEEFVQLQGDETSFQLDRAKAYTRLGFFGAELDDKEKSISHFQKAEEIAASLAASYPGVVEYQSELSLASNNLGEIYRQNGRWQEAEQPLIRAVSMRKSLVHDHPGDGLCVVNLACSYNNLGLLYTQMPTPRHNQAEQSFLAALDTLKKAGDTVPAEPRHQLELPRTYNNLALLYKDMDRPKDAEQAFEDSLGHHRALAKKRPDVDEYQFAVAYNLSNLGVYYSQAAQHMKDEEKAKHQGKAEALLTESITLLTDSVTKRAAIPEYQAQLARAYHNQSLLYRGANQIERAVDAGRSAVQLEKTLTDRYPTYWAYQHQLGDSLHDLTDSLLMTNGPVEAKVPVEARDLAEQAIVHQKAALRLKPENTQIRIHLRNHYWLLLDALLFQEEHAAAAEAVEDSIRVMPNDGVTYHMAARCFASCALSAQRDKQLKQEERVRLAKVYRDRALELLEQAVGNGHRDVKALLDDELFEPLRQREEFQKLITRLRARPK